MRMSIEEIIAKETEIVHEFQQVINTHMVSEDLSLEEMYCDDTEVIEEQLQRCEVLADYHNQIADTMRKYQKIEQIISDGYLQGKSSGEMLLGIKEVMNGNAD